MTARQNSFRLVFSSLLLLLLISVFPVRPAQAASTHLETIGNLGTKAHLELRQSPLTVMKATPFTLRTTPALPTASAMRDILCDLTMPAMPMPLNRPKVQRDGNDFSGTMVFTMAGAWQAEFVIPRPEGKEERFVFAIQQVLLK